MSFYVDITQIGDAKFVQEIPISSTPPTDGQVLEYNLSTGSWEPASILDSGKVDKSGDTMTGDLFLSIASDVTRQLGCNDLQPGDTFRVLMGSADAFIEYDETAGSLISQGRTFVGARSSGAARWLLSDRFLVLGGVIIMVGNRISNIADPTQTDEGATKAYVDNINTVSVTASASGGLSVDAHTFSFGDDEGTNNTAPLGWVAPKAGTITDMSLSACSNTQSLVASLTAGLVLNGVEQVGYTVTKGAAVFGATTSFGTPLAFSAGDRINFISKSALGGQNAIIVSFLARI